MNLVALDKGLPTHQRATGEYNTTIRHWKETGYYGYAISFEGKSPHHGLNTCGSKEWALDTCDPHRELIWDEVNDEESGILMVSSQYKPGSVLDRLLRYEHSLVQQVKSRWSNVSANLRRLPARS